MIWRGRGITSGATGWCRPVGPDQVNVDFKAYRWNMLSLDDTANNTLHVVFAGTNGVTYRLPLTADPAQFYRIVTP